MIPRIQPPPESEIEAIHAASLRVLEEVGVVFPDREARELLAGAGADVHADSGLVKIPRRLVEEALTTAPRDVLLAGREPARDVRCDGSDTFLTLDGTGAYTLDHRSGERRASTLQDLADACRVADAAPEVGVVWNIVSASDAAPATQVVEELAACVRNTSKHIQGEVQRAVEVPFVMEILAAAADCGRWDAERPNFSIVYCPVPPLQHEPRDCWPPHSRWRVKACRCASTRWASPGRRRRSRSPAPRCRPTPRSSSSIVLFQLVRPGLPCIYVADTGVLDMRAGIYAAAPPESVLLAQAMVGLARRYDLPVMATGLTSDANEASMMSGVDGALTALASMLMGPDLLVGAGMFGGAQMLSLPKILLDCEIFRECRRVRAGMTVDEAHLMTGVVAEVGPGGHFLKARQTRQYMRSGELYLPELMLREPHEAWRDGRQTEVGRAVSGGGADPRHAPREAAAAGRGREDRGADGERRPRAQRQLSQSPITCARARRRSAYSLRRLGVALAQFLRRRDGDDLEGRIVEDAQLERVALLVGEVAEEPAEQVARRLLADREDVVRRGDRELLGEEREAVVELLGLGRALVAGGAGHALHERRRVHLVGMAGQRRHERGESVDDGGAGRPALLLVGRVGTEGDDHHRAVRVTATGYGAETAGDELLATGALADAPRQHVQLFDRVFHERSLLWVAGRR